MTVNKSEIVFFMNWDYSERLPGFSMFLPPSQPSPFSLKVFIYRRCKVNHRSARFLCAMNTVLANHEHVSYSSQAWYIAKWGVLLPSITDEQAADRVKKVKRITSTGEFILARWVDMKPYERKWKYIPDFKQRRYFINEIPSHGGFYRVIKVEKCPFLCCKDRAFGIQWMF